VDWSLIYRTDDGLYRSHGLLRTYAAEKLAGRQQGKQSRVAFAVMSLMRGDFSKVASIASEFLEESDEAFDQDRAFALAVLGVIAGAEEDYERCLQMCEAGAAIAEDNPFIIFFAALGQTTGYIGVGDDISALAALRRALASLGALKVETFAPLCLPATAILLANDDRAEDAAAVLGLLGESQAVIPAWLGAWKPYTHLPDQLMADLGPDAFAEHQDEGRDLALSDVTAFVEAWGDDAN
ncbi:MAG: hypothetical protein AAF125_25850, partial [Chloroflexota bacterium]